MKDLEKLIIKLGKQLDILSDLLRIETQKSQVIIQGDVAELDKLVNIEQSLVMKSAGMEEQRKILLMELGLGEMTISQVIKECPGAESSGLSGVYTDLLATLLELRKTSDLNQKLLRTRLEVIDYVLSKTGLQSSETGRYESNGTVEVKDRPDVNGLLNKQA